MDKAHLTADALCEFAEGLMPPADRREAEAHLAGCSECRREAEAMQGYFREMAGLETLKAPDRFLTKVHGRIAKASPWRRLLADLSSPRLLPVPLMGLAVILIGVYFAFLSPRFAEQVPAEAVAVTAPPAPEPTVRLAKKQKLREAPAAASPQAGASADVAPEPPPQVAMAPAKPSSPVVSVPRAEKRAVALARANKAKPADRSDLDATDRFAVGKAAPARPKGDVAAAESTPVETEALAFAEASRLAEAHQESKAKVQGAGPGEKAGSPERKREEVVEWKDNPSAIYIMGNTNPAGDDAVHDQIANSRGPADLLKDAPASPAPPAAKAEAAPVDKAAAKTLSKSASRISETADLSSVESDYGDMRQLEAEEAVGYAAPGASSRNRSAPAAAPPATTPKPWAPLGYTLKARTGDQSLRNGLAKLGVKVLRQDDASGRRYELEVPATRVIDLEAYLKGLGALTPSTQPLPGKKNGAPLFLTLKVVTP